MFAARLCLASLRVTGSGDGVITEVVSGDGVVGTAALGVRRPWKSVAGFGVTTAGGLAGAMGVGWGVLLANKRLKKDGFLGFGATAGGTLIGVAAVVVGPMATGGAGRRMSIDLTAGGAATRIWAPQLLQ